MNCLRPLLCVWSTSKRRQYWTRLRGTIGYRYQTLRSAKASKNPEISKDLTTAEDIASISRRARYSVVYLLHDDNGRVDKVVLPVHGYGLWSIMYGFVSLEGDFNTVSGITFYEQGETAGLVARSSTRSGVARDRETHLWV